MKEMISRRSFLRVMGLGFGAAMLTACKTGTTDSPADSPAASVPAPDTPVPFLTEDEFPRLDGSTACIPLMAQMKADVTGMDLLEAQTGITVSTTAYAWENFGLWSRSDSEDYGAQLLIVYEAPEYVKEELAEALNLDLSDEDLDYDTLGGLVFSQLSVIPDDGSRPIVEALGLRIQVEELCDRRVEWALVEKLEQQVPTGEPAPNK